MKKLLFLVIIFGFLCSGCEQSCSVKVTPKVYVLGSSTPESTPVSKISCDGKFIKFHYDSPPKVNHDKGLMPIWPIDQKGKKVASGLYLVVTSDSEEGYDYLLPYADFNDCWGQEPKDASGGYGLVVQSNGIHMTEKL
jgi:hypothetical protein